MTSSRTETREDDRAPTITLLGRRITLPRSRALRIGAGIAFVCLGLLGFLPILGFWMIPVGLVILSYEFAIVRRARRRLVVWWETRRRRQGRSGGSM